MHNKAYAVITGAFLLLFMAATLMVSYWLLGAQGERRPFIVVTDASVSGLSEGAQIYYRGVRAGRVSSIRLDSDDPAYILIEIDVRADIPLRESTVATLRQSPLTGLTQIDLSDSGEYLPALATSSDDPARIPMQPGMFDELTATGMEVVGNVNLLLERVNELLDDDMVVRLSGVLERVDSTLEATSGLVRTMDRELADSMVAVRRSLQTLDALGDGATGTLERVDALLEELTRVVDAGTRLGDEVLVETMPGLNRALQALDTAGEELARLARALRQQPDSLLRGPSRQAPGPGEE